MLNIKQIAGIVITLSLSIAPLALAGSHDDAKQDSKDFWQEKEGFWTGGVTQDAREHWPEGNTQVYFNVETGPYLADIQFTLEAQDRAFKLEGTSLGPIVVTDLEPGSYHVKAHRGDEAQGHYFRVEENRKTRIGLTFPES